MRDSDSGIPTAEFIRLSFICILVSTTPASMLPRVKLPNITNKLFIENVKAFLSSLSLSCGSPSKNWK